MRRAWLLVLAFAACTPRVAVTTARYPNGRPKFEYETENGVPQGIGRGWHANGTLRSEGRYEHGVKEGAFLFYDDAGHVVSRVTYVHGKETERVGGGADLAMGIDFTPVPPRDPALVLRETLERGPLAAFATLDRTTDLARAGGQVGASGGDGLAFGDVSRYEVFANVVVGTFGAYVQVAQAFVSTDAMDASGRQTLDVGGTYHHAVSSLDHLTLRAGVLAPVGHADAAGAFAASAGAAQRAADIAESTGATLGLRTSGSFVHRARYVVLQGDAGIDWMGGARDPSFDPILRFDAAAGIGVRRAVFGVELANAVRARELSQHLSTFGVSATVWVDHVWLGAALSTTQHGEGAVMGTVGYGF